MNINILSSRCASSPAGNGNWVAEKTRRFVFDRDSFSFANELVWQYRFDPKTGTTTSFRNQTPPRYAHRCFVLARSARQFFYHAHFRPGQPIVSDREYHSLIRQVVLRSPRFSSIESNKIEIPGYDCLRSFSQGQMAVLQSACGGAWQSYLLRSHWRMILPVSRRHQSCMVEQIVRSFPKRIIPIVHIFRFPKIAINHGVLLFDYCESASEIAFQSYDPNLPDHPMPLVYNRKDRTFYFPRTHYWAGGRVDVVETYCGWLY
jgi:hypothetical protein